MRRLLAMLLASIMLCAAPCAQADHYGWAFVIYDLQMSLEIDNTFTKTDDETLKQTNSFERSGNVKPDLILEVYNQETRSQLFVYSALGVPYDNISELAQAYAEDLGAVKDGLDANGTYWQILPDQQFSGVDCYRILSSFENVNAEYNIMLSPDNNAYIITMITFDGVKPDSQLNGIKFGKYYTEQSTCAPGTETAPPSATPDAAIQPTSVIDGIIGAFLGKN